MEKFYTTERLTIKLLTPDYAPEVFSFLNENKELFNLYELPKSEKFYTIAYQRANLKCEAKLFSQKKSMRFYIFKKENANDIIGTVSINNIIQFPFSTATLGYKFAPNFHHMGYASEAISCIINAFFKEENIHRLEAFVIPENTDSIHLLERLGFDNEGLCRKYAFVNGSYRDHFRYSLINETVQQSI